MHTWPQKVKLSITVRTLARSTRLFALVTSDLRKPKGPSTWAWAESSQRELSSHFGNTNIQLVTYGSRSTLLSSSLVACRDKSAFSTVNWWCQTRLVYIHVNMIVKPLLWLDMFYMLHEHNAFNYSISNASNAYVTGLFWNYLDRVGEGTGQQAITSRGNRSYPLIQQWRLLGRARHALRRQELGVA